MTEAGQPGKPGRPGRRIAARAGWARRGWRRRTGALAVATVAGLLAASCTSGSAPHRAVAKPTGDISRDVAAAGRVTLNVWDQEVRGGRDAQIRTLDAQFHQKYPNVVVHRTSRSFTDLKTTLKLALSGKDAPDVVEANQGYPAMGTFVKAGYLLPLDGYAKVYHWRQRYPRTLLDLDSFHPDGTHFGSGSLYGLSQTGEIVGIYYDRQVLADLGVPLPRTWDEFTRSLATIKAKGQLPIQFGNLDRYPAIHLFGVVQAQEAGRDAVRDLVFGRGDASWTADASTRAAATLRDWAAKGYLTPGANGLDYDRAWKRFAAGTGAYLVTGTWLLADLQKAMGNTVGFLLPPPAQQGGDPVTTGGQGLAWSVTSRSAHPDVAAAYIDFITNSHAADVMTRDGALPVVAPRVARVPAGTAQSDVVAAWKTVSTKDSLVPYLDYTTPTFHDTIAAHLQALIGGRESPPDFGAALQKDYRAFLPSR